MTKKINWQPNERVDIPDMDGGTNLLSNGLISQLVERLVLDHFARVGYGYRIQIANQVTAPGEFSVFNGAAWNRQGQIFNNEDEENTSRSFTLLANGTYFVEVLFVQTPSDTDARAFWDPTFDNGTDPSGDARLPGREFAENVATRLSPDWQIVTPISTTGFEIFSNPNSGRIPVGVITVAGGVITGASTSPPVTVLEDSINAGATSIKCLNTVEFPDAFSATLDAEVIAVTSNDRFNGVLTLGAGTGLGHTAGARLVQTGSPNQFLVDRLATAIPSTGTQDARPRFWQGDPNRGYVLQQDPYTPTGRSDTEVQSLKDKVDELSAQIRELKFGAARDGDMGVTGPPVAFPIAPRDFDLSGGVTGARANTCSIGDGVNTWGDFNVTHYVDAAACFAAAITYLGVGGGTIYVKRTNGYDFPSTVVLPSSGFNDTHIIFIGEGPNCTSLNVTGTTPIFGGANYHVTFKNLTMLGAAGADGCIGVTTANKLAEINMENCRVEGMYAVDHSAIKGYFRNCVFRVSSTGNPYPVKGDFQFATFQSCEFDSSQVNVAGSRAFLIGSPTTLSLATQHLSFVDCLFETQTLALADVEFNSVGAHNYVTFERCQFDTASVATIPAILAASATTNAITDLWIRDCNSNTGGGLADLDNLLHAVISGCEVSGLNDGGANGIRLNSFGCIDVRIHDVRMFQGANSATSSIGIDVVNCEGLSVTSCNFNQNDVAIRINNASEATIRDNWHTNGGGAGRAFVLGVATGSLVDSSICDNHVQNLNDITTGSCIGIQLQAMVVENVEVTGNTINGVGGSGLAGSIAGITILASANNQINGLLIADNIIQNLDSTIGCFGIVVGAPNGFAALNVSVMRNQIDTVGATALATGGIEYINTSVGQIIENRVTNVGNTSNLCIGISISASSNLIVSKNIVRALHSVGTGGGGFGIEFTQFGHGITVVDNIVDPQSTNMSGIGIVQLVTDTVPFFDVMIRGNIIGSNDAGSFANGVYVQYKGSAGVLTHRIFVDGNQIHGWTGSAVYFQPITPGTDLITDVSVNGNKMMNNQNNANGILVKECHGPFTINDNNIYLKDATADAKSGIFLSSPDTGNVSGNTINVGNIDNTFGMIYIDNSGGGGIGVHVSSNIMSNLAAAGVSVGLKVIGGAPTDTTAAANVTRNIATPYTNVHTAGDTGINQNQ